MKASKFQQLLDVVDYGMEFQRDIDADRRDSMYDYGVIETTGFIASCMIVQWFDYEPGIGGCDVVEALDLTSLPKRKKIEKRMRKLFKDLDLDTQEDA